MEVAQQNYEMFKRAAMEATKFLLRQLAKEATKLKMQHQQHKLEAKTFKHDINKIKQSLNDHSCKITTLMAQYRGFGIDSQLIEQIDRFRQDVLRDSTKSLDDLYKAHSTLESFKNTLEQAKYKQDFSHLRSDLHAYRESRVLLRDTALNVNNPILGTKKLTAVEQAVKTKNTGYNLPKDLDSAIASAVKRCKEMNKAASLNPVKTAVKTVADDFARIR